MSLRGLAGKSGLHFASLSRVEVGSRKPRPQTLKKIADALGVEVVEIASHDAAADGAR